MAIFSIINEEKTEDIIEFRSSTMDVKSSSLNVKSSQLEIDLNNL